MTYLLMGLANTACILTATVSLTALGAQSDLIHFNDSGDTHLPAMYWLVNNQALPVTLPGPIVKYGGTTDLVSGQLTLAMPVGSYQVLPLMSEIRGSTVSIRPKNSATYIVACDQPVEQVAMVYGEYLASCTIRYKSGAQWLDSDWDIAEAALTDIFEVNDSISLVGQTTKSVMVPAVTVEIKPNLTRAIAAAKTTLDAQGLLTDPAATEPTVLTALADSALVGAVGLDFCQLFGASNSGSTALDNAGKSFNQVLFSDAKEQDATCAPLQSLVQHNAGLAQSRYRDLRNSLYSAVVKATGELGWLNGNWGDAVTLKVVGSNPEVSATLVDATTQQRVEITTRVISSSAFGPNNTNN